jgi:hypothetical protein
MKKLFIITLFVALAFNANAQEEKEMKKGWSFGLLPTATFSVDNGYQAGAFGDVYNYGDGSTYPDPLHKISWEASYFTKSHRVRLYLAYDSKYLIPGMRVNASVTYMTDPLYSFWGFNGPAAVQDYDMWSNRYALIGNDNLNYYGMSRNMLRVLANLQGRITDNLNWAAGVNFWDWKLGQMKDVGVDLDKDGTKQYYNNSVTLFDKYKSIGAITEDEANGGLALELNAGLVYDTRDIEAAPNRGIWAEAYLNGNVLNHRYLKACAYFRHYVDIPIHIPAGDPVFAYRLAWQQTIAGETPFYMIQNIPLLVQRNMISEGFGSSGTIRGLRENRILTEGMAWANTELRIKLVKFTLAKQYFYIAVNPFFDAGIITKPYRANELLAASSANQIVDGKLLTGIDYSGYVKYLTDKNKTAELERFNTVHGADYNGLIYDHSHVKDLIYSAGAGLKIAMNQNFIVSADFAKCFTPGLDAGLWIGIGINYQF